MRYCGLLTISSIAVRLKLKETFKIKLISVSKGFSNKWQPQRVRNNIDSRLYIFLCVKVRSLHLIELSTSVFLFD